MTDSMIETTRAHYGALVQRRRLYGGMSLTLFFLLFFGGFYIADSRNAGGFWNGLSQLGDFPAGVLTEAWEKRGLLPGHMVTSFGSLIETINIAAVSTLLGALFGLLFALMSIRGLAPWPRLTGVFRRLLDVMRAIPEIVIALVLIFMLGGGPVPAVIAIAFHTTGALGKLFSEVAENADLKPVEGLTSVGAGWVQRMQFGVLPQVLPNFLSYALLRFEINIRASAILGFVGAGGLGYDLKNAITWGQGKFDEAAAIFLLLFGAIMLFDQMSSVLRNRLTHGAAQ